MERRDGEAVLDTKEKMTSTQEVEHKVADVVVRMVMETHTQGGTTKIISLQEDEKETVQVQMNKRLRQICCNLFLMSDGVN